MKLNAILEIGVKKIFFPQYHKLQILIFVLFVSLEAGTKCGFAVLFTGTQEYAGVF